MIGRIVWFAAFAALALVTTALQIDMQSKKSASLAQLVPSPLRNHAQAWIAQDALAKGGRARAVNEAKRLVRRRPLPAENLALLATAQAKAGDSDAAARTIQIAGQRGWREPLAQEAVLRLALAAGDQPEAARRYAALFLRDQTPDALLKEFGPTVLGQPGGLGQQTMVAIVVGGERWHSQFLRRGAQVMPTAAFAQIVAGSIDGGALFDCKVLNQTYRTILRRDAASAMAIATKPGAKRCLEMTPQADR